MLSINIGSRSWFKKRYNYSKAIFYGLQSKDSRKISHFSLEKLEHFSDLFEMVWLTQNIRTFPFLDREMMQLTFWVAKYKAHTFLPVCKIMQHAKVPEGMRSEELQIKFKYFEMVCNGLK